MTISPFALAKGLFEEYCTENTRLLGYPDKLLSATMLRNRDGDEATNSYKLRRRRPRCGDKWHMDEVFLTIRGERHYLWRAVDQDGNVLDMRVAKPPQQKSSETLLPQAPQGTAIRPTRDHHR